MSSGQLIRRTYGQGPWSPIFAAWEPRTVPAALYEALREAIPIFDAAIDRLLSIDGTPVIVGENDALVNEIDQWMQSVQVGDVESGLAIYARNMRNEIHEQGFSIGEYVLGPKGRDVIRLNVGDSKAISFGRDEKNALHWYYNPLRPMWRQINPYGTTPQQNVIQDRFTANVVASQIRNMGYIELDQTNKVFMAFRTDDGGDPYGVSLFRPLPFVAKILLTIENGVYNSWERFGDPMFHVNYKASGRVTSADLDARRQDLQDSFNTMISEKRNGNSADFFTAVDKDSDIGVSVIGHEGQVIEVEMPARHVLEQAVAKFGIPAWMLGLHFSTAERLAKSQAEILKQESDTRTEIERPKLERPIAAMLRARGRTWSDDTMLTDDGRRVRRDWHIEYIKPNLADEVAKAQARFMNSQADAVRANAGLPADGSGGQGTPIEVRTEGADGTNHVLKFHPVNMAPATGTLRATAKLETRPIPNAALDQVENDTISGVNKLWNATRDAVSGVLALPQPTNAATSQGFSFTDQDKKRISDLLAQFTAEAFISEGTDMGPMALAYTKAWAQGVIDGWQMSGLKGPAGDPTNDAAVAAMRAAGDKTFATNLEDKFSPRIWRVLEAGAESGRNPADIARDLNTEFDGMRWKFEQIARTEIAMAHDNAKHAEWQSEIDGGQVDDAWDWIPAPDACPICAALTAGNPYTLATLPHVGRDTHPSDRCTTGPAAGK